MLLGLQVAFPVPLLISIAFRARGNYFAHMDNSIRGWSRSLCGTCY